MSEQQQQHNNQGRTAMNTVIDGLTVRDVEGEPMVLDIELAERLGYTDVYMVRRLIKRLRKEEFLSDSDICVTVTENTGRGRRGRDTWLNESGALDVCLASRTPTARAIYRTVKQVFMAWRRGQLPAAAANTNAATPSIDQTLQVMQTQLLKLESQVALMSSGRISPAHHRQWQHEITRQAELEHAALRYSTVNAARSDIYREMREITGWGGRGQPWRFAPAGLIHPVGAVLRGRDKAVQRELRLLAEDRQLRLPNVRKLDS